MLFGKPKYRCKAAEYSLLFQPSGEILSCHYNRGYILGIYPHDSISSIWDGKKRKKLISSIHKGKFDHGCHSCKMAIESNLTHAAGFYKYDYIENDKSSLPISMEFQLDNICNLECIMCSGEYSNQIRKNREKGEPYISPYDDNFINQLDQYIPNLKYAAFTGGEPFLFDIYYKIWDKIKILNPDLNIYISTNGTVLDNRVKEYLNSMNFNFTISIDSLNKTNYEKIRKNAVLENTLQNIAYFNEYTRAKNKHLNIKCLVTPQNYMDIPNLLDYCNQNEIYLIPKIVILPAFASIEKCSNTEIKNIISVVQKAISSNKVHVVQENNSRFEEIISQLNNIYNRKTSNTNIDFDVQPIDELKNLLSENIKSQIDPSLAKEEKEAILTKIKLLLGSIEDEIELRKALIGFLNVPSELLIGEFHRTEINKLIERFKQSSKN